MGTNNQQQQRNDNGALFTLLQKLWTYCIIFPINTHLPQKWRTICVKSSKPICTLEDCIEYYRYRSTTIGASVHLCHGPRLYAWLIDSPVASFHFVIENKVELVPICYESQVTVCKSTMSPEADWGQPTNCLHGLAGLQAMQCDLGNTYVQRNWLSYM